MPKPPRVTPLAFALALGAALPAAAQSSPWYAGLSFGQSRTDDALVANREATIANASAVSTDFDAKDTAWRLLAGYRFLGYFALEAGYADYGSARMATTFLSADGTTGPGTPGGVRTNRDVAGFGLDLVATAPLGERLGLFGRLGWLRAEVDAQAEISGNTRFSDGLGGTTRSSSVKEDVLKYGIGLSWTIAPNADLRLEWERLVDVGRPFAPGETGTTGEADVDTWLLGLAWRF